MPNRYRVDRNQSPSTVPCGMNSILYIGDSALAANKFFNAADPGKSPWGTPNSSYGVTLAIWDGTNYIVKRSKGL